MPPIITCDTSSIPNTKASPFYSSFFSFYKFIYFIYIYFFWLRWVFVAVRGLFSSCGERGLLFVVALRLLIAVASLVAEHGL